MNNTARRPKITVSADGQGLVSQAGALLLAEAARVTGLGEALTAGLARWRAARAVHDPGAAVGGHCFLGERAENGTSVWTPLCNAAWGGLGSERGPSPPQGYAVNAVALISNLGQPAGEVVSDAL